MVTRKSNKNKCNLALKKIGYQFPKSPCGQLMFGVLYVAVKDLYDAQNKDSAMKYLLGDMRHVTAAGVNPEWVLLVLRKHKIIKEQS